jgi:hypothetical protein
VRDLTLEHYETAIATYLSPFFGKVRLNRISVALIERFRSELRNGLPAEIVAARATRLADLAAEHADQTGNRKFAKPEDYSRAKLVARRLSTTTINKQLTRAETPAGDVQPC